MVAMQDGEEAAMVGEVTVAAKAGTVALAREGVGTVAVAKVAAVGQVVKVIAEAMLVAKGVRVAVVARMVRETRCEAFLPRPRCCWGRCHLQR